MDLFRLHAHGLGHFLGRWLAAEFLSEHVQRLAVAGDRVSHVHWQADGAALVGDGPRDGLTNPPGGVSREAEALAPIVFLDGTHEADVAFLNKVQKSKAAIYITLSN